MRAINCSSVAIFVLAQLFCLPLLAAECELPASPDELSNDDTTCLSKLDEQFAAYSLATQLPTISFRSDRNRLLIKYSDADYQFIIDTFYFKYCDLLTDSRWQLSTNDQNIKRDAAKDELYARVPFGTLVVDTRPVVFNSPPPKTQIYAYSGSKTSSHLLSGFLAGPDALPADEDSAESGSVSKFLQEVPYVVTKANKHFVMIASVGSLEDARSEVRRFKKKAPQFDFVVYSPYSGNSNYAIMMASWVPMAIAEAALADALEFVSDGSMIWSCRSEGDQC